MTDRPMTPNNKVSNNEDDEINVLSAVAEQYMQQKWLWKSE